MTVSFTKDKIEEIRSRANIVDVISEYVSLKKVGKNYQALCPFHSEKTPSFSVNEEKQIFYCFGCRKGGDVITFLQEASGISFVEAVRQLAEKYGISFPSSSQGQAQGTPYETLIRINEQAIAYYHRMLVERPEGEAGRTYLEKRGIHGEVWKVFKLGYAPDRWDGLVRFLASEKLPLELGKELGLISSRKGGGFYDCFRGRIMFPIFDVSGKPIGFGGRDLGGGFPKYLNSPESPIYKKRLSLFGLPITRKAIRDDDRVFIVEGYFDLLSLYQAGIFPVIAPLGTALTNEHIQTLKRFTTNFYIVFDGDPAGQNAALRSLEMFLDQGVSPRVLLLPPGSDPDEFIKIAGPQKFHEEAKQAPYLLDHFVDVAVKSKDISNPYDKDQVIRTVMPMINRIDQAVVQDDYIRRLSEKLMVREDHIRVLKESSAPSRDGEGRHYVSDNRREEFLLTLMLHVPTVIPVVDKTQVVEDFSDPDLKEIAVIILEAFREEGTIEIKSILGRFEERLRGILIELSMKEENFGSLRTSLKDCICQIKRTSMKRLQMQLTQEIRKAQDGRDETEVRDLTRRKIQLSVQERDLNNTIGALLDL
ncbi:MAG: DNA primase [Deltaproteobacteria bacterium]|nr:DNA primase [Deltaproteobacteria bacterium]